MYDNIDQQRNLVNHCTFGTRWHVISSARTSIATTASARYSTATSAPQISARSTLYAGPFEFSEAETRNGRWLVDTFSNIKFSLNVQSDGGYFMWPPGAYNAARVTLPRPGLGLEAYHFAAAEYILSRVQQSRGTAVLPERVGALSDVRASEAGNSADDLFYAKGIIAYTMAIGADRFESMTDGTDRSPVGVRPDFAAEGLEEALEFADGVFGLLEQALAYSRDVSAPSVGIVPNGGTSSTPMTATFSPGGEPSVVYYTLDGSTPTIASPTWEAERPRLPGFSFLFTESTTVKWMAIDIKGNVSAVRSADFLIDATLPAIFRDHSVRRRRLPARGDHLRRRTSLHRRHVSRAASAPVPPPPARRSTL